MSTERPVARRRLNKDDRETISVNLSAKLHDDIRLREPAMWLASLKATTAAGEDSETRVSESDDSTVFDSLKGRSSHSEESQSDASVDTFFPEQLDTVAKVFLLQMQKPNAETVSKALQSLGDSLSTDSASGKDNLRQAMLLGAPSLISLTMKKWANDSEIQTAGCYCFIMMTLHGSSALEAISLAAAVDAIIHAMKGFPFDEEVVQFGATALFNVLDGSETATKAQGLSVERFVYELDGIGFLIRIMKHYHANWDIQDSSCGIFKKLAKRQSFRRTLLDAGAVEAAKRALKNHSRNKRLRDQVVLFLSRVMD